MREHRSLVRLIFILFIVFCATSVHAAPNIPIVSYLRTWPIGSEPADMQEGVRWNADNIKGDLLSTINIAFALLDGNTIYIKDLDDQPGEVDPEVIIPAFTNLFDEIAKIKTEYPHIKINLSIGGWGADGFSDMALTKASRTQFINDVAGWLINYNLDGVDIDWEYPVGPEWGQEITSRPEDADNYVALLSEMRKTFDSLEKKIDRNLSITVAIPASTWFPETIDVKAVQEHVDYLKLMTYDFYGAWSDTTGHASNLYNNPADPEWGGWSVDQTVSMYMAAGVTPKKILLGVPFYGRAWSGVNPSADGLFQEYAEPLYEDGINWMDIKDKILTDSSFKRYWDNVAKAAYLYNGDVFITYEDEETLANKVDYIMEKGLGGIMIWEYGHDINAELLHSLNDAIKAK